MILSKHKFQRDPAKWHTIIKSTVNKSHIFRWPWYPVWHPLPPKTHWGCSGSLCQSSHSSWHLRRTGYLQVRIPDWYPGLVGRRVLRMSHSIKINLQKKPVSRGRLATLPHLVFTQQSQPRPVSREWLDALRMTKRACGREGRKGRYHIEVL